MLLEMADVGRELQHYRSRLQIWWAQQQRRWAEQRERTAEQTRARQNALEARQRQLVAGDVVMPAGWQQHPKDPPGLIRWWDGDRWTDHTQLTKAAVKNQGRKESGGLAVAGVVTFLVGLLFWPVFLATFVLGIILATKPGRGGDGAILIVLSLIGPLLSLAGCAAIVFH